MDTALRIRTILLIGKIRKNEEYARAITAEDCSHYRNEEKKEG